jgi:hypothetical protein
MADCHIGSWRDQKLRDLSIKAFIKAIDECIKQEVDFVLISGDLFNTALPAIDSLKLAVKKLKDLKDKNIPVYGIAGSHDYSSSGKTMIDVLVNAGIFTDVFKGSVEHDIITLDFTEDKKTGAKITGIKGRKGMLDKKYYEALNKKNLEDEKGFKIFLFHTAISEIKPKELEKIESAPMSYLPKGFDYYAGGHVHYIYEEKREGYGLIVYPGALFPANFFEMEKYGNGGFFIVDVTESADQDGSGRAKKIQQKWVSVPVKQTFNIQVNCDNKNPKQVEDEINEKIKGKEFINTIVLIRVSGTLFTGKPSDINFKGIFETLNKKSAYFVMKSTSMVTSREFADMKVDAENVEDAEEQIIDKNLGFSKLPGITNEKEKNMIVSLIKILSAEKEDGEKVHDFEKRISEETEKIIATK